MDAMSRNVYGTAHVRASTVNCLSCSWSCMERWCSSLFSDGMREQTRNSSTGETLHVLLLASIARERSERERERLLQYHAVSLKNNNAVVVVVVSQQWQQQQQDTTHVALAVLGMRNDRVRSSPPNHAVPTEETEQYHYNSRSDPPTPTLPTTSTSISYNNNNNTKITRHNNQY